MMLVEVFFKLLLKKPLRVTDAIKIEEMRRKIALAKTRILPLSIIWSIYLLFLDSSLGIFCCTFRPHIFT